MIAYLEGTVLRRDEESCVLLTAGGVGYQLHLTTDGLAALPGASPLLIGLGAGDAPGETHLLRLDEGAILPTEFAPGAEILALMRA